MKKIIVPTDFSANAMKAVTYAAEISKRSGAAIYLLHVIEPVTDSIRQPYALHERLQEEIANARLSELQSLKNTLADVYPDLTIETELAKGTVTTLNNNGYTGSQWSEGSVFGKHQRWHYWPNKNTGIGRAF